MILNMHFFVHCLPYVVISLIQTVLSYLYINENIACLTYHLLYSAL